MSCVPHSIQRTPSGEVAAASEATAGAARVVACAAASHVGRRRKKNEDSFAALPDLGLFMVADGIGGLAGGEVASRLAVEAVRAYFEQEDPDATAPAGRMSPNAQDLARLVLAVRFANRRIREAGRREPRLRGMGTTFAGVLASEGGACVAHVGDSRVYRFRRGHLDRLTRDHSLAEEPWRVAELGAGELEDGGDLGNVVTRALGAEERVDVEARPVQVLAGDVLLLCSDGLWGPLVDVEMEVILAGAEDLDAAASALIAAANDQGGPDNVTCVLVRFG